MKTLLVFLFISFSLASVAQTKHAYQKLADSLLALGQNEKVITLLQKELKKKPKDEDLLRLIGFVCIESNKLDDGEKYYKEAIVVNPNCARCYMNLGRVYAGRQDFKKSLEYLDKGIAIDEKDAMIYVLRGKVKDANGDKFRALFDFNKAVELDPSNPDVYLERANYNINQGYLSFALTDVDKAIELKPSDYRFYQKRSEYLYNKGMLKEALTDIDKAIKLDGTVAELYTARGAVYSNLKDYEMAFKDYDKAIELNPDSYVPYYNRYYDKYQMEDMDGACEDVLKCQAILARQDPDGSLLKYANMTVSDFCDSTKASYYYQRGIAFYNTGKYDKAVRVYTKGLQKFPDHSFILQFRANTYLAQTDYTNAISDYYASIADKVQIEKRTRENPRFATASKDSVDQYVAGFIAASQLSTAEAQFYLGKYEEALKEINKGIEIAPDMEDLKKEIFYNLRGNIYLALGRPAEALQDFDQCLKYDKGYALAYVNRAVSKAALAGEIKTTSYSISGGVNNKPFNPNWTLPVKTKTKKEDGKWISALEDCNKAISIDPNCDYAYYMRGQIKKILSYSDYCYDILKAKDLGFPVEPEVIKECLK